MCSVSWSLHFHLNIQTILNTTQTEGLSWRALRARCPKLVSYLDSASPQVISWGFSLATFAVPFYQKMHNFATKALLITIYIYIVPKNNKHCTEGGFSRDVFRTEAFFSRESSLTVQTTTLDVTCAPLKQIQLWQHGEHTELRSNFSGALLLLISVLLSCLTFPFTEDYGSCFFRLWS